jgi:hypothetical protein
VLSPREYPIRIRRLDLTTGVVTPWKDVEPSDIAGALGRTRMSINSDGDAYAYTIERMLSDLYVVEGLR